MTGALPALQERLPCPLADVDLVVGTSAGSVLAAALRCGFSIEEMIAYQRGEAIGVLADAGGRCHRRPVAAAARAAGRLAPAAADLAADAAPGAPGGRRQRLAAARPGEPPGPARHGATRCTLTPTAPPRTRAGGRTGFGAGRTWIVAVDYDRGRRVVFGRPGAPRAPLADAVVASCSIPGWYQPAVIGGRRYVDGGVRSPTSLRSLARAGVDEVFVLAPMASVVAGCPRQPHERLERRCGR